MSGQVFYRTSRRRVFSIMAKHNPEMLVNGLITIVNLGELTDISVQF